MKTRKSILILLVLSLCALQSIQAQESAEDKKAIEATIENYFEDYNALPSEDAMQIELQKLKTADSVQQELSSLSETLKAQKDEETNVDILRDILIELYQQEKEHY